MGTAHQLKPKGPQRGHEGATKKVLPPFIRYIRQEGGIFLQRLLHLSYVLKNFRTLTQLLQKCSTLVPQVKNSHVQREKYRLHPRILPSNSTNFGAKNHEPKRKQLKQNPDQGIFRERNSGSIWYQWKNIKEVASPNSKGNWRQERPFL
jgi:hypothetical protein